MSDDKLVPMSDQTQMTKLFEFAMDKGADGVAALEKLVVLQERMLERQAVQAFNDALATFKARCPKIEKTTRVEFTTRGGGRASYNFPKLEQIEKVIRPVLEECGFSYTWASELSDDAKIVTETCTLSHVEGHSASSPFSAPTDATSTLMSPQQKIANAGTFCMRQSLIRVLGLVACEPDTDCSEADMQSITDTQAADLDALIDEVGADRVKLAKLLKVDNLQDTLARDFPMAVRLLEAKRVKG